MKRDYFEGADIAVTVCAKDGWYDGDEYAGFMELSIVLPENIPNRVRKPKA